MYYLLTIFTLSLFLSSYQIADTKNSIELCFKNDCFEVFVNNKFQQSITAKEKNQHYLASFKNPKKLISWNKFNSKAQDIIWLDKNFIVIESLNNSPGLNSDLIISKQKASHILKMPSGTIKKKSISIGDQATILKKRQANSKLKLKKKLSKILSNKTTIQSTKTNL